jgi:hypothetical protein
LVPPTTGGGGSGDAAESEKAEAKGKVKARKARTRGKSEEKKEEKAEEKKEEKAEEKKEEKAEEKKEEKAEEKKPSHAPPKAAATVRPMPTAAGGEPTGGARAVAVIGALAIAVITVFNLTAGDDEEHGAHEEHAGVGLPPPEEAEEEAEEKAEEKAAPTPAPAPEPAPPTEGEGETGDAEGEGAEGETGEAAEGEEDGAEGAEGEGAEGEPAEAPAGAGEIVGQGDPRAVPPGTPNKNARAFSKLKAAADDKAPIGEIGETGIHVDRIALGDTSQKGQCSGKTDGYSVAEGETVHVCFRVVHDREIEEIKVAWVQDGKTKRRTKMEIPDKHAHSARARLKAREGMAGKWVAVVESADGAELAKIGFSMAE